MGMVILLLLVGVQNTYSPADLGGLLLFHLGANVASKILDYFSSDLYFVESNAVQLVVGLNMSVQHPGKGT
jgi:hypothetical protein